MSHTTLWVTCGCIVFVCVYIYIYTYDSLLYIYVIFQTHRCAYCPLRTRLTSHNVTSRGLRQFRILYKAGSCRAQGKGLRRLVESRHSIDTNLLEPKIRTISTSTFCLTREFLRTILDFVAKNVASRNIVRTLPLRTARTTKHDHNINQATARTRSNIAFFFSRISQFCAKSLLFCLRHPRIMRPFSCP